LSLSPASDTGIVGDNITTVRRPLFIGKTDPGAVVDVVNLSTNQVLGTGVADANGNYTAQASPSADLQNGTYILQARAHGVIGTAGPTSPVLVVRLVTVDADFNGDGKTDLNLFQRTNTNVANWFVPAVPALINRPFGAGGLDVPVMGDFLGQGKTDLAYYRPSTAQWFIQAPSGYATLFLGTLGAPNVDIPVPADYYGSGVTVLGTFNPNTGNWTIQYTSGTKTVDGTARPGDVPVPGDYDNVGHAELAVFRPSTGLWLILGPNGVRPIPLGTTGDVPVPGAYDATVTNHAVEPATFTPTTGKYVIHGPAGNRTLQFAAGDVPAPGDYDGFGVTEAAVFRPSTGQWFVWGPRDTGPRLIANGFGTSISVPVNAPYAYRALRTAGGGIGASSIAVAPGGSSLDFGGKAQAFNSVGLSSGNSLGTLTPPPARPPVSVAAPAKARRPAQKANHPVAPVHHFVNQEATSRKGHRSLF
jgi:hypothetical protein